MKKNQEETMGDLLKKEKKERKEAIQEKEELA